MTVVELAIVTRSGRVESRHFGSLVAIAPDGSVLGLRGDAGSSIYPRSAVKPLQAKAALTLGVAVSGPGLAIACGSHAGAPDHVSLVHHLLESSNLSVSDLQCPVAMPARLDARDEVVRSGGHPSRVFHNCSGKHALMLAACVQQGWATSDYLDLSHPLQQAIAESIATSTGEHVLHVGVDGCGAPAPALSLIALARGVQKIATRSTEVNARIADAMLGSPWAVGAVDNPDSVLMQRTGFIAKVGAEGVMVVSTPHGYSIAMKFADGSLRAAGVVALSALTQIGALDDRMASEVALLITERVLGGSEEVGGIISTLNLMV